MIWYMTRFLDEDADLVRTRLASDYGYEGHSQNGELHAVIPERRKMPAGFSDDDDDAMTNIMDPVVEEDEVGVYMKKPRLKDGTANPFLWWEQHESEMPTLTKMARDYLAIPSSSLGPERANSIARSHWEDRARMGDNVFQAEICLGSWYDAGVDEFESPEPEKSG